VRSLSLEASQAFYTADHTHTHTHTLGHWKVFVFSLWYCKRQSDSEMYIDKMLHTKLPDENHVISEKLKFYCQENIRVNKIICNPIKQMPVVLFDLCIERPPELQKCSSEMIYKLCPGWTSSLIKSALQTRRFACAATYIWCLRFPVCILRCLLHFTLQNLEGEKFSLVIYKYKLKGQLKMAWACWQLFNLPFNKLSSDVPFR